MSKGNASAGKNLPPNPYDFIWNATEPERKLFSPHDRFTDHTGFLECHLEAETAIFIPQSGSSERTSAAAPATFIRNAAGVPIVPGSSLKGLLRSLMETLGPGCWSLYNADGPYVEKLPSKPGKEPRIINTPFNLPARFRHCSSIDKLCPACRMFGMIEPKEQGALRTNARDVDANAAAQRALLGKVGVDDAECQPETEDAEDAMHTVVLAPPKPHHTAWYWHTHGDKRPAGRKYYLHHPVAGNAAPSDSTLDKYIVPVGAGSTFSFRVYVTNITDEELALLVYALVLEEDMRHKIGMAKPYGFGSAHLTIIGVRLWSMEARYRKRLTRQLDEDAIVDVADFVRERRQQALRRIDADTLGQLRRIWRWPVVGMPPAYPDRDKWFRISGNSGKKLDTLNPRA